MIRVINEVDMDSVKAGIYMITFSDGRFYIGCSRYVKQRILSHIGYIRSNFRYSCPSLRVMKDFHGCAIISMVEDVVYTDRTNLLAAEADLIKKYSGNKLLINVKRKDSACYNNLILSS